MEVFKQLLKGPVWDGDLASKDERDRLKMAGLCERGLGYCFITMKGVEVAVALGLLRPGLDARELPGLRPVPPAPFPPAPPTPPEPFRFTPFLPKPKLGSLD